MTLNVRSARLEVYKPTNDGSMPDTIISSEGSPDSQYAGDFEEIKISQRIQDAQDKASFALENPGGRYTDRVTIGDRVVFRASDEVTGGAEYSEGPYSEGAYSGSAGRWWGMVGPGRKLTRVPGNRHAIDFECEDFVYGVLANRLVYRSFENMPIAGEPDGIVNRILRENAPEVSTALVGDIDVETSLERNGENVVDVLLSLARRADAVMYSRDDRLVFEQQAALAPSFHLSHEDYRTFEKAETSTEQVNDIRIDGASDRAPDQLARQPTVEEYVRVNAGNRIIWQLSTSSNRLAALDVWTRRDPESEDSLTVRIHPNRDGAPTNPNNSQIDLYRRPLTHDFISLDDFTTFLFADEQMPTTEPWLIIDTDGETGHEVGVRSSDGAPAYQGYYPYSIAVRDDHPESIAEYRRREGRVKDNSISSFVEARDVAVEHIKHDALPKGTITFTADSQRAHALRAGDVITVDEPIEAATGDYLITKADMHFHEHQLDTTFQAVDLAAF